MGLGVVVLTDAHIGVGAGGVEVPQRHVDAVGLVAPLEHPPDGQLGGAVGVGGVGAVALFDGLLFRLAVGGGSGGEDDLVHAVLLHGRQHGLGARHVVAVVLQGFDLSPTGGIGGEVDDAVNVVLAEQCPGKAASRRSPT